MKLKLFIAEFEQLLQNQHLEQDQRINPLAPRVALSLLRVAFSSSGRNESQGIVLESRISTGFFC